MTVEVWFVDVCIRILGIVRFEKQTDGTRRRTLRADPDVESGFKELITLKRLYHTFQNALRSHAHRDDALG
jgi:hypothetical protein